MTPREAAEQCATIVLRVDHEGYTRVYDEQGDLKPIGNPIPSSRTAHRKLTDALLAFGETLRSMPEPSYVATSLPAGLRPPPRRPVISSDARDNLGRVVREAWVNWAKTQTYCKDSWLVPWNDLSENDREADRQIGEAVADYVVSSRRDLTP